MFVAVKIVLDCSLVDFVTNRENITVSLASLVSLSHDPMKRKIKIMNVKESYYDHSPA